MPINADNSPNIVWPLPAGIPAFSSSSVFPNHILDEIKSVIATQAKWGPEYAGTSESFQYHTVAGRWVTELDFSSSVWEYIESMGREKWGIPELKLKYIWLSRYQQFDGVTPYLWKHVDQNAAQYTADICIEAHGIDSWGLEIDGERFEEEENSGIFFMGQQQVHNRPPYPVDDEDAYLILLFASFVTPDHWAYDIDFYTDEGNKKFEEAINLYRLDADIRFYELMGRPASFNEIPENNKVCEGCNSCWVVDPNLIYEKLKIEKID